MIANYQEKIKEAKELSERYLLPADAILDGILARANGGAALFFEEDEAEENEASKAIAFIESLALYIEEELADFLCNDRLKDQAFNLLIEKMEASRFSYQILEDALLDYEALLNDEGSYDFIPKSGTMEALNHALEEAFS